MLPKGRLEPTFAIPGMEYHSRENAYEQLLRKNAMLEKEIEKLWLALNQLMEKHKRSGY